MLDSHGGKRWKAISVAGVERGKQEQGGAEVRDPCSECHPLPLQVGSLCTCPPFPDPMLPQAWIQRSQELLSEIELECAPYGDASVTRVAPALSTKRAPGYADQGTAHRAERSSAEDVPRPPAPRQAERRPAVEAQSAATPIAIPGKLASTVVSLVQGLGRGDMEAHAGVEAAVAEALALLEMAERQMHAAKASSGIATGDVAM